MARTADPANPPGLQEDSVELDVRYWCCLCMERYNGRSPKLLPCFHSFCLPCLQTLEASAIAAAAAASASGDKVPNKECDEKEDSTKEESSGKGVTSQSVNDRTDSGNVGETPVFLCPTCRAPVPVPDDGVVSMQDNFYVVAAGDGSKGDTPAPAPALCGMCEDGDPHPADHSCQQCQLTMCRNCRRYHDKLMAGHQVTAIPAARGAQKEAAKRQRTVCSVHVDQPLCFHCRDCGVSVCLHCRVTSHEGHDTMDLATAALQAKREMSSLVPQAQHQVQVLESSWQQTERDDCRLTRQTQEVQQQIEARYTSLLTWPRQARDHLLDEVTAKETASRGQLTAHKSSTALLRDSLSSLLSQAVKASSVEPGVVMLKNELKEALLSDEALDHHTKRAQGQELEPPCKGWDYDVTDASVLPFDDIRAYMGRVTEGAEMGVARPPALSLKELTGEVDTWMNDVKEAITKMTSQLTMCEDDVTAVQKKEAELEEKVKSEIAALSKNTEEDLRKKTSALSDDITAQKKMTDTLEKTTQSLVKKMETSGKMISFIASGSDRGETNVGSPIVFRDAKVNNGGCYDNTTGYFTVTVPGCYTFTCSVRSYKKDVTATAVIVVDDTQYSYLQGSYTSGGCSSVSVQLGKGQKVWVQAHSEAEVYYRDELLFTGALVQPEL
ncbi:hypothetical protein ACOMHN_057236 [Nucella lapillus]